MRTYTTTVFFILICTLTSFGIFIFLSLTAKDRSILFAGSLKIDHGGFSRSYLVSTPSGNKKKLVVALHGFGGNARQFAYFTALHNATDDTTVVVYPDALKPPKDSGLKTGWNAGFCCGTGWKKGIDDVGFLSELIDSVKGDYGIADDQVSVIGFSNGAFMAQRLGAEKPSLFRAIVSVSGTIGTEDYTLKPTKPVPILLMHGRLDERVLFNGGASKSDLDFVWLSHDYTKNAWQKSNGCDQDTEICLTPVKSKIYNKDGHKWHGWRIFNIWHKKPEASIEAVKFINEPHDY